jgi:dTDP-4-dehydrorhamnose reductase
VTRWLVTGAGGQLGHHLTAQLRAAGEAVTALTRADLDIRRPEDVDAAVASHRPDVVVNAAAYTAVDAAESEEATAFEVNATGPELLARALAERGGRLVQVSTDYVFDGAASRPYEPGDPTGPRTAYGRTKLAGEEAVGRALPDRSCVVRTAWVYGGPGPNFVDTMRRLESERETVDVVDDQVGSPTWVADLAGALIQLGRVEQPPALLHYVNTGVASWFDVAREVFRGCGADPGRVRPTTTAAMPRPAPRPAWSVLSTEAWTAAGLPAPRPWQDALADALAARAVTPR